MYTYIYSYSHPLRVREPMPIDTKIQLATCNRCNTYVFACTVSGFKTAADPAPLDVNEYRDAVIGNRPTYDLLTQAGRPWKLQTRGPHSMWPPYGGRAVLGAHTCGAKGMDASKVEIVALDPRQAPATHGSPKGGYLPLVANGQWGSQAATSANRHRSDIWRCVNCKLLIQPDELRWSIEYGYHRWAVHDRKCNERKPSG